MVTRGAFAQTLAAHKAAGTWPLMFWMHQPDQVAGAWLDMHEDESGLRVRGKLADTALGNEVHELLRMKALRGLSIGYRTVERDFNGDGVRILKTVELLEVSIVSLAMNPLATVERVKTGTASDGAFVPTRRQFERELSAAGLSRKDAWSAAGALMRDAPVSAADTLAEIEALTKSMVDAATLARADTKILRGERPDIGGRQC